MPSTQTEKPKKTGIPPELQRKINQNKGIYRAGDAQSIDGEDRAVELSFASDQYVEDWPGLFIRLSHEEGDYDFERLNSGGPVLVDHKRSDQVGVTKDAHIVSVDGGKRSRAKAKFSRSNRGTEIYNDVVDGIRKKTSCRFDITGLILDEETEEGARYYTAKWRAYEVSIVPIPADDSVGVGRGLDTDEGGKTAKDSARTSDEDTGVQSQATRNHDEVNPMPEATKPKTETKPDNEDGKKPVVSGGQRSKEDGPSQHDLILRAAEKFDADREAAEYLRSAGGNATLNEFQEKLLENGKTKKPVGERGAKANEEQEDPEIGMDAKEKEKYSFIRAMNALANPGSARIQEEAKLEIECSQAVERKMGKRPEGIFVPFDVLSHQRSISVGGTGSNAVATDLLATSFVELLRKKSALMRLVTPLTGLVGDVDIPSQESAATAYWLGEDDEITDSESGLGNRPLTPKTVGAVTEVTRKQLMQSSIDMENFVRQDLSRVLALEIDRSGLYGLGSSNQPKGVANMTGVNQVDFAGLNPTWPEIVDMETQIASDDADADGMLYLFGAGMKGHLTTTQKFSGTNGAPIIDLNGEVNGYQHRKTNQVLANEIFFGNWRDLILAMWGALDLTVDPYTHSKRGKIIVIAFQSMDWIHRHVESFCHGKQFTP